MLTMYMMASTSGIEEIIGPQYVEIADYYDNRKAVVTVTADYWYASTWKQFEDMSKMLIEKRIYYTGAIITGMHAEMGVYLTDGMCSCFHFHWMSLLK